MIRVRPNTPVSPVVTPAVTPAAVASVSKTGTESQILDKVELSPSASAVPEDRSNKIAALKALVDSPGYLPPSLPVIQKLVSGALSRTD
jgi:hypothetical protein